MHSSYLQFGNIHLPIVGIFVALGLTAALSLSQLTARYARIDANAVWNAGVAAICSAFVVSRLLLIAFNFQSFLQYPLLVLALPSLTTLGIFVTAIFMLGYIRWRRLPLLPLLDAAAPCVALFWAFLSLGEYLGGTRDGMPSGPSTRGALPTPQPVELLSLLAAVILCGVLLLMFRRGRRAAEGTIAAAALAAGGIAIFFLDFLRLPSGLVERSPLDPSQIIGVVMLLAGGALLRHTLTKRTVKDRIEAPHAV